MPCPSANKPRFSEPQLNARTSNTKISSSHGQLNNNIESMPNSRCIAQPQVLKSRFGKHLKIKEYELCHWLYNDDGIVGPINNTTQYLRKGDGKKRTPVKREPTLTPKEMTRLKTAATTKTIEDHLEELARQEAETKRLDYETQQTRQKFRKIDETRQRIKEKKMQKDDTENNTSNAMDEDMQVLERAYLAKHDQEEEVKNVNRIILNAKCHAVRDAQIQEKLEIEKAKKENDFRLEQIVLDNAKKSLLDEDDQQEKMKIDKMKYATEIKKQLSERERIRFLEAECIEDEAKRIRKANEALKLEEERELLMAKERRRKFREELDKIAEMSNLFKRMLCEQECEAEMRVAAYQREKNERQLQLKMEQKIAKEAFERKQQRIYTLAQKILESKSEREEQRYLREQEQIDREYRQKEMEAAIRKRRIEKELRDSRETQLQETKHRQAAQIARAEKEFNELIDIIKAEDAKQNKLDSARARARNCYRQEIIKQINSKDMERRHLEELENQRFFAWRESERQREKNIRAVINAKLDAMRGACLPEKYIKEVEMQLQKLTINAPK